MLLEFQPAKFVIVLWTECLCKSSSAPDFWRKLGLSWCQRILNKNISYTFEAHDFLTDCVDTWKFLHAHLTQYYFFWNVTTLPTRGRPLLLPYVDRTLTSVVCANGSYNQNISSTTDRLPPYFYRPTSLFRPTVDEWLPSLSFNTRLCRHWCRADKKSGDKKLRQRSSAHSRHIINDKDDNCPTFSTAAQDDSKK